MSLGDPTARVVLRRPDLLREAAYIGARWVDAAERLPVEDPASGTVIGSVPDLGAAAAENAVAAAAAAFRDWRRRSAGERAQLLARWHAAMLAHAEDLALLMTREQGKPLAEARGEVGYAAAFLQWFAEEARRAYGDVIPGHGRDKRLTVTREPVGVVAAITPWNFPLAMITRKAGAALAAGCTIVVKPSELTPFSALALAALAEDVGIPPGVFNVITGSAQPIGDVFVSHPDVAKLSFTGSTAVGKMLAARSMESVKRVSLELGGNAPFLVFEDADLDAAVDGAIVSKFRNAGQTCVCANRFLVQAGIYKRFVARFAERVQALRVGPGTEPGIDVGPLINAAAVAKAERHVTDAVAQGGELLVGGIAEPGPGNFFAPTLIRDVPRSALLCREETFGPVAGIVRFEHEGEAIALANATSAGLAAYFYTNDLSRSHRVSEALQYGMVGLNTGLMSTEVAPFGGVKQSGFGREGSRYGMDDYLSMKLVVTAVAEA